MPREPKELPHFRTGDGRPSQLRSMGALGRWAQLRQRTKGCVVRPCRVCEEAEGPRRGGWASEARRGTSGDLLGSQKATSGAGTPGMEVWLNEE